MNEIIESVKTVWKFSLKNPRVSVPATLCVVFLIAALISAFNLTAVDSRTATQEEKDKNTSHNTVVYVFVAIFAVCMMVSFGYAAHQFNIYQTPSSSKVAPTSSPDAWTDLSKISIND